MSIRHTLLTLLIGSLAIAFTGCSKSIEAETAAKDLADAICDLGFRCCSQGELDYLLGPFTGEGDCAERLVSAVSLDTMPTISLPIGDASITFPNVYALDRAIQDDRVRVRERALRECVALLSELACNGPSEGELVDPVEGCDPTIPEVDPVPPPCAISTLVVGNVEEGESCTTGSGGLECKEGLKCLTLPTLLGVEGACGAPQRLGQTCFDDGECAEGLYCSYVDGTCQEPQGLGEPCLYSEGQGDTPVPSTLLVKCAPGLTCSPFDEVCVGPCTYGTSCTNDAQCEDGLVCIRLPDVLGTFRGYCDAPHAEGEPCEERGDCQEGLTCEGTTYATPASAGKCTTLLANGAMCASDLDCASGICGWLSGSCIAPLANAQYCVRHLECSSGFCDEWTGQCAASASNGQACPTGQDAQCTNGRCVLASYYYPSGCSVDGECASNSCDTHVGVCRECTLDAHCNTNLCESNSCVNACQVLLADGASCTTGTQCASGVCVNNTFCGTPPFPDGEQCSQNSHCESGVCNFGATPTVCITPPLANGQPCYVDEHCASHVCHNLACRAGLGAGESCGPATAPCDPFHYFCDLDAANPECTPFSESGESCSRNLECRSGNCTVRWGRLMCSTAAPLDGYLCSGE
jgi:hypothetical protein